MPFRTDRIAKKVSSAILSLVLLSASFPASVFAAPAADDAVGIETPETVAENESAAGEAELMATSGTCGTNLHWFFDTETGVLNIFGTGKITSCESESQVPWYSIRLNIETVNIESGVTGIGDRAFYGCKNLKSITIPAGVTSIGTHSFSGCSGLTEIILPDGMRTIGDSAFYCCTNLSHIVIPKSVINIHYGAFSFCKSLKNISFPEGVWYIGHDTFYNCTALTSFDIPKTVEKIEIDAFAGCTALQSVTIPNGVTTIYERAFNNCSALTKIELPKSLKYINKSAFANCRGLKEITIPGNVKSIGAYAFAYCYGLTKITVSDGVTSIGEYSFRGCSRVTELKIPDGVKTINKYAFYECSRLKSVTIPNTVTSIGSSAFGKCTDLKYVYYRGTESEWNAITGMSSSAFPAGVMVFFDCSEESGSYTSGQLIVASGQYVIRVIDDNGDPISEATVEWLNGSRSQTAKTDADGRVTFSDKTLGDPVITVSKQGYISWTNEDSYWKKSGTRYEDVTLFPNDRSGLSLVSARYRDVLTYDVLHKTKTVSVPGDADLHSYLNDGKFSLICEAKDTSDVSEYYICQGKKQIEKSTTGVFDDLCVTDFEEGDCYVRVIGHNNAYMDTHLNLVFEKDVINKANSVSFGPKGISFAIKDSVPFVGGSKLNIGIPLESPITFDISDSPKIKIGFNCDIKKPESDVLKKLIKKTRTADSVKEIPIDKKTKSKLSGLMTKKNKCKFFKDYDITLIGYAEGDLKSGTANGQIFLLVDVTMFEAEFNTVVVVVPVTVQVEFSFNLEAGLKVEYNWKNNTFNGNIFANPTLKLEAFGGIGVSKFVGVGAYGSAELSADINLAGTQAGIRNVDLTGELGLKAYLAFLTYEKAFAHNTWHLYTANSAKLSESSGEAWLSGENDASNYHVHDLSYLANESAWNTGAEASLLAAEAKTELIPLLSGTYRNARPVMTECGGTLYAAFVRADDDGNTYVAVTKYGENGWCEPVRTADTFFAEAPSLYAAENGELYLAYVRADAFDKSSFTAYADAAKIVVGTLDPDTLAFDEQTVITSDDYIRAPQFLEVGGKPTVVFGRSAFTDDNSVLMPAATDIVCLTETSGTWGAQTVYASFDEPVWQTLAAEEDGSLVCAAITESGLYVGDSLITDAKIGKLSYGTLPGSDKAAFIYNTENTLADTEGNTITVAGITNEYAVIGSDIYYSRADEEGANLYVLKYGTSELPIRLTDTPRYLENLNVVRADGRDYVLGMATLATITEGSVNDDKNLVFARVTPVSDIIVDYVLCEEESAGETVPVIIGITNAGDHAVTALDVTVDGNAVSFDPVTLAAGESTEIEIELLCPNERKTVTVCVSEQNKDDYTPSDNEKELTLGLADLSLKLEQQVVGSRRTLIAYVTNEGIAPTAGRVILTDADGKTITESAFDTLACGDVSVQRFEIDETVITGDGLAVYANVLASGEERSEANNSDIAYLQTQSYFCSVSHLEIVDGAAEIGTWCDEETDAKLYIAEYDADGRLLSVKCEETDAGEGEYTVVLPTGCACVKAFMMNGRFEPLCESAALAVNIA